LNVLKINIFRLAIQWGTSGIEEHDYSLRADYEARAKKSGKAVQNNSLETQIPEHLRITWLLLSALITLSVLLVDGVVLLILIMSRIALYGTLENFGGHLGDNNVEYARYCTNYLVFVIVE